MKKFLKYSYLGILVVLILFFQNFLTVGKANFAFDEFGGTSGLEYSFPKQHPLDVDLEHFTGSNIVPGGRLSMDGGDQSVIVKFIGHTDLNQLQQGEYSIHRTFDGTVRKMTLTEANPKLVAFLRRKLGSNSNVEVIDFYRKISNLKYRDIFKRCDETHFNAYQLGQYDATKDKVTVIPDTCLEDESLRMSRNKICDDNNVPSEVCTLENFRLIRELAQECHLSKLNDDCSAEYGYDTKGLSSVSFDPRYAERAYRVSRPSDCLYATSDKTGYNPKGAYECYKLYLFTTRSRPGVNRDGSLYVDAHFNPAVAPATVVVRAYKAGTGDRLDVDTQEFVNAQIDDTWRFVEYLYPDSTKGNRLVPIRFRGYELTTTADARFLFFTHTGSHSSLDQTDDEATIVTSASPRSPAAIPRKMYMGFMFNPRPWDPKSYWTRPLEHADMWQAGNDEVCFGVNEQDCDENPSLKTLLKKRYPILQEQPKNPDGSPFAGGLCGYPWISADGEEIICGAIQTGGNVDSLTSFMAMGRRTNWTWTLVDTFNRVRGGKCPPGMVDPETNKPKCLFKGILHAQSFGLTSGNWVVPKEMNLDILGVRKIPDTYALTLSAFSPDRKDPASQFAYANFKSYTDGDYIGHFPFNEQILSQTLAVVQNPRIVQPASRIMDLTKTPDNSGNFLEAKLGDGVRFFYDLPSHTVWSPKRNSEKWVGNSIYTDDGSYVAITPSQNTLDQEVLSYLTLPIRKMTVEFAFKLMKTLPRSPNEPGCYRKLVSKYGSFAICLTSESKIMVQVISGRKTYRTDSINYAIQPGEWTHVSLRYSSSAGIVVNLFAQRNEVSQNFKITELYSSTNVKTAAMPLMDAGAARIFVGPIGGNGLGSSIFGFDELKISRVIRTDSEIADSEFSHFEKKVVPVNPNQPMNLPLGLDQADIRIPRGLASTIKNPNYSEIAQLGKDLFKDKKLSGNGKVSCASCHVAQIGFADGLQQSLGVSGLKTGKNAPTIFNRSFAIEQMFAQDTSLDVQALKPINNPKEMAGNMADILVYLKAHKQDEFNRAYGYTASNPIPITQTLVLRTLGAYMFSVVSGASHMDGYLNGGASLGSNEEQILRGMKIFVDKGRCVGCHRLSNFSDELKHATGVRLNRTIEGDEAFIKTPTLRNIAETRPYFHDGSSEDLNNVITFYTDGGDARTKQTEIIAVPLTSREKLDLQHFLNSLSGNDNRGL